MTTYVVVDSSFLIADGFGEVYQPQAAMLLSQWQAQNIQMAAPTLLRYELIAVTRKAAYRGRFTFDQAREARDNLLQAPVQLFFDDALLKRAYDIATQLNRSTAYDAQYLALAERLDCEFWTADEKLFNAAVPQINQVRWLGTIAP